MLIEIIRHTPLWVWGLLAALLILGARQTRPQRVARAQLLALPLSMLTLGLVSLAPLFLRQPMAAWLWLLALALAGLASARLTAPRAARWNTATARLELPGSVMPLLLIIVIFGLKYGFGVSVALHPTWRDEAALVLPMAMLQGSLGGFLLGRALALLALTWRPGITGTVFAHD